MTRTATTAPSVTPSRTRHPLYSSLIGLATLAILLQGLWAGLFTHEGKHYKQS